jgi:adenine-specific DNA-methyltransferase
LLDDFINSKKGKPFENNFIDKKTSLVLFEKLFSKLKKFKYWMLSYNNSSYPTNEELLKLIKKFSNNVKIIQKDHNYQLTGKQRKTDNKEFLFIVETK